jgi:hypothetical protein
MILPLLIFSIGHGGGFASQMHLASVTVDRAIDAGMAASGKQTRRIFEGFLDLRSIRRLLQTLNLLTILE